MADPILHIKDSYYFEVPRPLWPVHYETMREVPEWLQNAHPDIRDPHAFSHAMTGKILIPQPFGVQKNLYEMESGFGISKFMIIELMVAAIMIFSFRWVARKIATGRAPEGILWNFFEVFIVFIRDQIARPAIGKHDADRFVPYLWTIFFFVLGCNLFGLLPWLGAPTGAWAVTLTLAGCTLAAVFIGGVRQFGPIGFWLNQVPHMDLPWYMSPLRVVIWVIEVAGLAIRHGILAVRLLANMLAGHLVLLGIMGTIVTAAHLSTPLFSTVAAISVAGSVAFTFLELFVAFLQAYIFTFLSALFIGAAVHHH